MTNREENEMDNKIAEFDRLWEAQREQREAEQLEGAERNALEMARQIGVPVYVVRRSGHAALILQGFAPDEKHADTDEVLAICGF